MNVGEFFVSLGVKGSDKTIGALTNVKKGLGETASTAFEAKAAIVGTMYALERLFATSGAAGTGLTNFNSLLGTSTKTLQEYQFAARQMGVANEEVAGTFKGLQGLMTKTLMGEGAPKGLARIAAFTGGITPKDIEGFQKNPELLIQKLQQYALKEKNVGLRNEVLKSFNISDSMISAMSRNAFRPDVFKKAPSYGDKEIGALDRANIAWSNLGTKIEMAVGHFNAKHGGALVKDITQMTNAVMKLAEAFERIAEKTKIFTILSKVIESLAGVTDTTATLIGGSDKEKGGKIHDLFKEMNGKDTRPLLEKWGLGAAPAFGPQTQAQAQNVEVNQTLNFHHDGKDYKKTGDSTKKAVQDYYRQSTAQGQGT